VGENKELIWHIKKDSSSINFGNFSVANDTIAVPSRSCYAWIKLKGINKSYTI